MEDIQKKESVQMLLDMVNVDMRMNLQSLSTIQLVMRKVILASEHSPSVVKPMLLNNVCTYLTVNVNTFT